MAIALAAAVLVTACQGATGTGATGPGATGTAPASPQPTATPSTAVEVAASIPLYWTSYASDRFAYSVEYPTDWVVTPATQDWANHHLPNPSSPTQDRFGASPKSESFALMSSDSLDADQSPAERFSQLDFTNQAEGNPVGACRTSDRHTFTLDGVEARREDLICQQDHLIEVAVVRDGRFYLIDFFAPRALSETERATFDRFLASFKFGD
jgi:hypothetical protein